MCFRRQETCSCRCSSNASQWDITYSLRRHVGGVGLYPVEELLRHQNETAAVWFIDSRTFAQGRVDKRLVRDEGVAGSNPATPTSSTTKALIGRSYLQTLIN